MIVSRIDAAGALGLLQAATETGEIDEVCDRLGVALLGLFGSAARGEAGPNSDLDVCVSFAGEPAELAVIDELKRITHFEQIDLAVIDGANPVIRARAMTGIGLYEDEAHRWATAQMAALGEYPDTAKLRALDLKALAE